MEIKSKRPAIYGFLLFHFLGKFCCSEFTENIRTYDWIKGGKQSKIVGGTYEIGVPGFRQVQQMINLSMKIYPLDAQARKPCGNAGTGKNASNYTLF